jgi:Tfp pilus assembly protein PilF
MSAAAMTAGRTGEARWLAEKLLEKSDALPNSSQLASSYLHAARVELLYAAWDRAREYLERGLGRYPDNTSLLSQAIQIEYLLGNLDQGITTSGI